MSMINSVNTSQVSVDEMKQNLLAYLQRVQAGETFVIVVASQPMAEMRPIESASKSLRPFGLCRGAFDVPDDFDAPLPEHIMETFEGR